MRQDLVPQDLLDRLPFRKLVNQLVQVADLLHQRVIDLFNANTADDSLDQRTVRMQSRRMTKALASS
jgi:hypothetical protein